MLLIPIALAATLAGSLLAPFYSIPQNFGWLLFVLCLLFSVSFCNRSRWFLFFVLLTFLFLANLRYPLAFPDVDQVTQLKNRDSLSVVGELQRVSHRVDERSQLDLKILQLVADGKPLQLSGSCRLRLYVGEKVRGLLPGDRLSFQTRLRQPRLFGTPGEFHWPRYLASQGVGLTGWVKNAEQLSVIGSVESFPSRHIAVWRERAATQIGLVVSERQEVLLRALLLGEAGLLPDSVRESLAHAGISHLFAISGLHLGLIGMLGYRLLFSLYCRFPLLLNWQPPQRVLPVLLLPVLFGYLLLTGDAISTRRAFSVAVFAAVFWLVRYSVNPLRLLMALALLFLLFNPLLLWQPAWQLSFAGAAGILLWKPFWQERTADLPKLVRAPVRLLVVTTAATLATLPLVLSNFHVLAVSGLLSNLISVPLVALLALPIGLCGLILSPFPVLGSWFFFVSGSLLELVLSLVEKLLALPGFSARYLFLSRWQYLAIALLVLPALFAAHPKLKRLMPKISAACFCLALLCGYRGAGGTTGLSLHVFSVGQGESMLLSDGRQQAILIDGGGLYSDRFDVGERLLAPALGELGVRRLSAVLLTHDHPDHRKGLPFILKHFPVDEFWTTEAIEELHPRLRQVLGDRSIQVRLFPPGWTKVVDWNAGDMQLYHSPEPGNKNDSSLVLYLQAKSGGMLLTGDLERSGVNGLLRAGVPGPVSVLKLPHHGSRHSASENLVRQLQPQFCVVSAGFRNRYGFPAQQLVTFLQHQDVPLYRTDILGTIRLESLQEQWQVGHWQDGLFR